MDIVNARYFDERDDGSISISHYHTGSHYRRVYLDVVDKRAITMETIHLSYPEFLKFADTVASIAQTIKENG